MFGFGSQKFGKKLEQRVTLEKENVARAREAGESWKEAGGSYAYPFFVMDRKGNYVDWEDRESEEDILGTEAVLYHEIKKRIEERAGNPPVIALDFGGTHGISFIRIAKRLEDEMQAVSRNLFIAVVSNLAPIDKVNTGEGSINGGSERLDFYREHAHLVHYIAGDAAEVRRATVHIGDQELSLRHNIDIVHERAVLQHSYTPDVALKVLDDCIREEDGVIISYKKNNDAATVVPEYGKERGQALGIAAKSLAKDRRLIAQDTRQVGVLKYDVYKRPNAVDMEFVTAAVRSK